MPPSLRWNDVIKATGADPLTFEVTSENSAKDRKGSYEQGVLQQSKLRLAPAPSSPKRRIVFPETRQWPELKRH
ncbi:hypothetical protein BGE01nite_34300 [Brevifollis gellanilyticus]|uniref:Uncharacterized protein n=1 Tax=Brevifollis gellanilyticus TaxID=748831 RepID=A0A512MBP3_9BACT|nr:hypothetical protein BGE01nite_34300 [Brevifollis gellanilyticus]